MSKQAFQKNNKRNKNCHGHYRGSHNPILFPKPTMVQPANEYHNPNCSHRKGWGWKHLQKIPTLILSQVDYVCICSSPQLNELSEHGPSYHGQLQNNILSKLHFASLIYGQKSMLYTYFAKLHFASHMFQIRYKLHHQSVLASNWDVNVKFLRV